MLLNQKEMIDLFTEDPKIFHPPPRLYSTLYLLRRDISSCLGTDLATKKPNRPPAAQWPGAMAILAGVDLLAKFYSGVDRGPVGTRFKAFLQSKYFNNLNSTDAYILYHLRNSLLHSFGLYSFGRNREYWFTLVAKDDPLIEIVKTDHYKIDVLALYEKFESGVELYVTDLKSDPGLQNKYFLLFHKYGSVYMN